MMMKKFLVFLLLMGLALDLAAPVCSPYRAALLTGQHPARVGITDYLRPNSSNGLSVSHIALPEILSKHEYATGMVGKWHLTGYKHHEAEFELRPPDHGFGWNTGSEVKGVGNGANFFPYVFRTQPISWIDLPKNKLGKGEYLTDRLNREAVEFIELIDGDTRIDFNWDTHANMVNYNKLARNVDQPIAGLLKDLKDRGLMKDTLVVFATEFGRGPFQPNPGVSGRGHHAKVFSCWLAGAGIKGGIVHGASDELGEKVTEDVGTIHDFQATILHLLGMDHERLTYRHAGRNFRLTDVHGHVVKQILS